VKQLNDLLENTQKQIKGLKAFSWQTLIFLSLFSWLVSFAVANESLRELLSRIGWIFLTVGLGWALEKDKREVFGIEIYPGPWVTGALVCGFVLRGLPGGIRFYLSLWPLVSVAIALLPDLLKHGFALINPMVEDAKKYASERQKMVLRILAALIFVCWFQFYFLVEDWLVAYPSLRVDDFSRSGFVIKIDRESPPLSRGADLLNATETALRQKLANFSWAQVEQWLATLNDQQIAELKSEAMQSLSQAPTSEDGFWTLQAQVLPGGPPYTIRFRSFWQGPSSRPQGFYAEKICQISQAPISQVTGGGNVAVGASNRVDCQLPKDRIWVGDDAGENQS
jgi:hypothetical protein